MVFSMSPEKEDQAESSSHALLLPSPASAGDRRLSSQWKTFGNIFIAIVGAGVLGLPYTFKRTGWIAGVIMLAVVGALTNHCMILLVLTRRRLLLDRQRHLDAGLSPSKQPSTLLSFGEVALAIAGPFGRAAVDAMIVLSHAGFCVGYFIFISNTFSNLYPIVRPAFSSKLIYVASMLPFQIGLNSIKTLTLLAPLSIIADIVDIGAMGVVLVEDLAIFSHGGPALRKFGGISVILYGLGVAVYSFEGIGMVLPLESEAADKERFSKTLSLSMALISFAYALFGLLGYAAFGEETKDIITANFIDGGVVSLAVQFGLCFNLFFTLPVMMNPVFEVVERRIVGGRYCRPARWSAVVVVALVALLVPNFADFLSLVGSSICCVMGFVLPAAFHLKVFGSELSRAAAAADVAIIAVGAVFAVSGTWSSLKAIFSSQSL